MVSKTRGRGQLSLVEFAWVLKDFIVTGGLDGLVKVWLFENNRLQLVHTLAEHSMAVVSVAISYDGHSHTKPPDSSPEGPDSPSGKDSPEPQNAIDNPEMKSPRQEPYHHNNMPEPMPPMPPIHDIPPPIQYGNDERMLQQPAFRKRVDILGAR